MSIKTYSNRSNAKRAMLAFRQAHEDLVDVGLTATPNSGVKRGANDPHHIEATLSTRLRDDINELNRVTIPLEKAGFAIAWTPEVVQKPTEGSSNTGLVEVEPTKAEAKAARKAAAAESRKEIARIKAERKGKPVRTLGDLVEVAEAKKEGKTEAVVALLKRKHGATVEEIVAVTDWLPHTARAFLSTLRSKKGYPVTTRKAPGKPTAYYIS